MLSRLRFLGMAALLLLALGAHADDYAAALNAFKGKQVKVYMLSTSGTNMTLQDVGTDYIKLRHTSAERNASVTHYVHFSAISDVRVNTLGTSQMIEIRVR